MGDQLPGFGAQLRRYRERAGLSQEALAERAQLTVSGLAALERGRRQRPYPATVRRLADALDLSADERAGFVPARPPAPDRATASVPPGAQSNLPAARSPLIGREQELAALTALVSSHPGRLVTLTGIGGGGKTRLALTVAAALRDAFPDGVWLVELAALADAALVPEAVASALGLSEGAGVPALPRLLAALQGRSLLLLLDNCEHLIAACADLCEQLLVGCPGVRVLATSREPLQLERERQWRVPPLGLPPIEEVRSLSAVAASAAVTLFVERAAAVDPSFYLSSENAGAIAQICVLLGGLPLALELAAARVRVLAVAQIRERLGDSLQLLTGTSRAAPTRQQTMRATLDWSYDLLLPAEQAVFRRLTVFAGTFELAAAEAVCAAPDLPSAVVLDLLTQLVDKSLVLVEQGAETARYRLLEPVRQYAGQRCVSDELEAAQARHAAYYLALAEQAAPLLGGPEQVTWLARLEAEVGNLRAALGWAEHHASADAFLRVVTAIAPYWEGRGQLSEGQHWLQTALARGAAPAVPPLTRARAQLAAGRLATLRTDLDAAAAWLKQSLTVARAESEQRLVAEALTWLGVVRVNQGAVAAGMQLHAESLALAEAVADAAGIAVALLDLGTALRFQGDTARSGTLLAESLRRFRALGDVRYSAMAATMLGFTCYEQGDLTRADALLREGLAGHQAVGDRAFIVYSLMDLAAVRAAQGQAAQAARLLGAMAALRDALAAPLSPISERTHARIEAATRDRLGEAEFTAAWNEGRALPFDAAVALALAEAPPAPVGTRASGATPRRNRSPAVSATTAAAPAREGVTGSARTAEPLTPREREVARLLAGGCTDREIAAALAISSRTVGVHVQHLIAKLGVRSRWQVADWARARGDANEESG